MSQSNFAWLVNRNFTQAQVNDVCSHSVFTGGAATCTGSSVGAIIDNRLRNISLLKTSGIDLIGKYSLESRSGRYDFGLNGTYLLKYLQANTPSSPLLELAGTQNNPINFRARGSTAWTRKSVSISTFVNFETLPGIESEPNRGVAPWTTIDLQLSYERPATRLAGWGIPSSH